jgi:predicted ATPase
MELYNPQTDNEHVFRFGQDPKVMCLAQGTWPLWLLGYADQALQRSREALTLALGLSHPHSVAYARHFVALTHQFRGENKDAQVRAEEALQFSAEQSFPFWQAMAIIIVGGALVAQGQIKIGIERILHGLAINEAIGAIIGNTYWLALLADSYSKAGQITDALATLTPALASVPRSEEHWWEADLYRLKGELLLASSPHNSVARNFEEAEACFDQALEIARLQEAKSLELRAGISLSRLWQIQGKKEEARKMLAEIYSWFTEGFDTADLKEAQALITKLS